MKIRRIVAGHYEGVYNGRSFAVMKWSGRNIWSFRVANSQVADVHASKDDAVTAAKYYIDSKIE